MQSKIFGLYKRTENNYVNITTETLNIRKDNPGNSSKNAKFEKKIQFYSLRLTSFLAIPDKTLYDKYFDRPNLT